MKAIIALIAALLVIPGVFAVAPSTTVIDGSVYSGATIHTAPVSGVQVDVDCNGNTLSDQTDSAGRYRVVFTGNVCAIGSTATVCVGSNCGSSQVISSVSKFNLLEVKLYDVPEFSTVAATAGLVGLSAGYFFIRKKNGK